MTDAITELEELERAVREEPSNAGAWGRLGSAYSQLDEDEMAAEAFQRALRFAPDDHRVWFGLANSLAALGRGDEAVNAARMAARHAPDDPNSLVLLGFHLLQCGRPREALAPLEDPRKVDPRGQALARQRALDLVTKGTAREATVWLAFRPGDTEPTWEEIEVVPDDEVSAAPLVVAEGGAELIDRH